MLLIILHVAISTGLIIQYGKSSVAEVILPCAYEKKYSILLTRYGNTFKSDSAAANHNTVASATMCHTITLSSFKQLLMTENNTIGKCWITCGY